MNDGHPLTPGQLQIRCAHVIFLKCAPPLTSFHQIICFWNQIPGNMNIFDEHFNRVDESFRSTKADNYKLIESVLEIGNARKIEYTRQKALADKEIEVNKLRTANKEAKTILLTALVERDELITKRAALNSTNERLSNLNDSLHKEIEDLLGGDEVQSICERFSYAEQNSILKDIQDTRCKLIKNGFPLYFFA